jgi:hypothetical protein
MRYVGIDPKKPPKDKLFCCDNCRNYVKSKTKHKKNKDPVNDEDKIRSYSLALVWAGLNLLRRRDAVREADGEAMIAYWR